MHAMRRNNGFHVLGTYKYMKGDWRGVGGGSLELVPDSLNTVTQ